MNIDQAYRFVQSIVNKEQRGNVKPSQFNLWAPLAQIEAISDRLGNVKKLNERLVPQYGYKANRKLQNELRQILVGPINLSVSGSGIAVYPDDYFYIDSLTMPDFTEITILDSDEYPGVKKSLIHHPDSDHPVAVFYGDSILMDPNNIGTTRISYIKYPQDPNWDYNLSGVTPVYNATATPGQTGIVSFGFSVDRSMHLEICWRILKFAGVNLALDQVVQMAKSEELTES